MIVVMIGITIFGDGGDGGGSGGDGGIIIMMMMRRRNVTLRDVFPRLQVNVVPSLSLHKKITQLLLFYYAIYFIGVTSEVRTYHRVP